MRASAFGLTCAALLVAGCDDHAGKAQAAHATTTARRAPDSQPQGAVEPSAHLLGPLRVGMSQSELTASYSVIRTSSYREEDVPYVDITVALLPEIEATGTVVDGKVVALSTSSARYSLETGAHVGMTLAQLERLYPNGEVAKGIGEIGRYFIFMTGKDADSFEFDTTNLSRECLLNDRGCPTDLETRRSRTFEVR